MKYSFKLLYMIQDIMTHIPLKSESYTIFRILNYWSYSNEAYPLYQDRLLWNLGYKYTQLPSGTCKYYLLHSVWRQLFLHTSIEAL